MDVEGGVETTTHHYIRSILPEGLIGATGKIKSGDELLEVNSTVLLGNEMLLGNAMLLCNVIR